MSEWPTVRLVEIAAKEKSAISKPYGSAILKDDYVPSGVPVVRGVNLARGIFHDDDFVFITEALADSMPGARLQAGDLVFTHRGSVGQVSMVPRRPKFARYAVSTSQVKARIDPGRALPEFLYHWFQSEDGQRSIREGISTVGVPGLAQPVAFIKSLTVPLPPLPEQQAIAEVLGALDDKIAANTKLAATADECVGTAYRQALASGARSAPLLDEFVVEFGEPFAGSYFSGPGIGRPLIRIRDLKTFESQVWTTEKRTKEIMVKQGDVVVGMDAEFRATPWLGIPGLLNQRVCRFSHEEYGPALVREAIKEALREVEQEKSATTVIHLNKSDIARKETNLPADCVIDELESLIEPLYQSEVALTAENRILAATRDALLPQLMSGKLRVRDAEAVASGVGA